MKPITLSIEAFGPFARRQTINFEALGHAPLFLINGPTGSGKSSILDAICFALYGETTGSERTGDQMRSDLASESAICEVGFSFSLGQTNYLVVRSPDQMLPKKRGEGLTKKAHSAVLYQLDEEGEKSLLLGEKPSQVTKIIVERIGLDVKQFRQVTVLPQGKFRDLLIANSKEREQIFGQLFQTSHYQAIERLLFDKAAGIRKRKEEFDNQLRGALDVVSVENQDALEDQIKKVTPEHQQLNVALKTAREGLEQAKAEVKSGVSLEAKYQQREALNSKLAHFDKQSDWYQRESQRRQGAMEASQLTLPFNQMKSAQSQGEKLTAEIAIESEKVNTLDAQVKQAHANWESANKNAEKIPELKKKEFFLADLKDKFNQITEFKKTLTQHEAQVSALNEQLRRLNDQNSQGVKLYDSFSEELKETKDKLAQLPLLKEQLDRARHLHKASVELAQTRLARDHFVNEHQRQQRECQDLEKQVEQGKTYADSLEMKWHLSQAAILANTLEDNHPCPVCGSLEHPSPAYQSVDLVTKAQVDQARHLQSQWEQKYRAAATELANTQAEVAKVEQAVKGWSAQLGEEVKRTSSEIDEQVIGLSQQIAQLESMDIVQQEKRLSAQQETNQKLIKEIEQVEVSLNKKRMEQSASAAMLSNLTDGIPDEYAQLEQVTLSLEGVQKEIETLVNSDTQTKERWQSHKQSLAVSQSHLLQLKRSLETNKLETASLVAEWQNKLNESRFEDVAAFQSAIISMASLTNLEKELDDFKQAKSETLALFNALEMELKEANVPDLMVLRQREAEAEQQHHRILEQFTQVNTQLDSLLNVKQRLETIKTQNQLLEAEYQVYGTLSEVANGKTGARVSLHRFVLGVLLDDVLIQASQRLLHMSKGRYHLIRKSQRAKGNTGSGLDLLVEDSYSGKQRDVATLSGGESFMAALSLALGVSDVVQSYSGGVRLDTLFIDEGFGSLDPESLDLAIQTLVDLQQGGRTIGVISHVSELKEQMALRLDVSPSRTGSQVAVVSG